MDQLYIPSCCHIPKVLKFQSSSQTSIDFDTITMSEASLRENIYITKDNYL